MKYKSRKYQCGFINAVKIKYIKIKLCIRRGKRRIRLVLNKRDVMLYAGIIILWMVFACLTVIFSKTFIDGYCGSFRLTLWELKNSIFSSVVLAFSIGAYNQLLDYRKRLKSQHWIYVNAMEDFERFLDSDYNCDYRYRYHYFYNDRCLKLALKQHLMHVEISNNPDIIARLDAIIERLNDVKQGLGKGDYVVCDEIMFSLYIDGAIKCVTGFVLDESYDTFIELVNYLFDVINCLRYPWRRDEDLDNEIIELLYLDNKRDIEDDFYLRMHLKNFYLDMLV